MSNILNNILKTANNFYGEISAKFEIDVGEMKY